jgi:hypothetical protein
MLQVRISSTTQLTWTRDSNAFTPPDIELRWVVLEFTSGKATVERGTVSADEDPEDVTGLTAISGVGVPICNWYTSLNSTCVDENTPIPTMSGTTLSFDFDAAPEAGECEIAWQMVDLLDGVSLDTASGTISGSGSTSTTLAVTLTTIANTVTLMYLQNTTTAQSGRTCGEGHATSTTVVTVTRGNSGSGNTDLAVYAYVLEFTDGTNVEQGTITLDNTASSATKAQASLTVTDITKCVPVNPTGIAPVVVLTPDTNTAQADLPYQAYCEDDSGDKISYEASVDNDVDHDYYYHVVEWQEAAAPGGTTPRLTLLGVG